MSRRHLFTKTTKALKPDGIKRLARAVDLVSAHIGRPVDGDIGVILYLRLRNALKQDEEAARPVKEALGRLCTGEARLGYWGRDDRGTNRFRGVSLLLTLCDPWPNIRSAEDDAQALSLDPKEHIRGQALAALHQAHGRSRDPWFEEPVLHVHVGRVVPPGPWFRGAVILHLLRGRPRKDGSSDRPTTAGPTGPPNREKQCV